VGHKRVTRGLYEDLDPIERNSTTCSIGDSYIREVPCKAWRMGREITANWD
jgi:hypothetical protein